MGELEMQVCLPCLSLSLLFSLGGYFAGAWDELPKKHQKIWQNELQREYDEISKKVCHSFLYYLFFV